MLTAAQLRSCASSETILGDRALAEGQLTAARIHYYQAAYAHLESDNADAAQELIESADALGRVTDP